MTPELTIAVDGLGFPESPVAMTDGTLLFVDIKAQTLLRTHAGGGVDTVASLPGGPNGVAIGPDGAAYVCNNGGVYSWQDLPGIGTVPQSPPPPSYAGGSVQRVDLKTGAVTTLYEQFDGARLLAPDDLVFDSSGGFWFTDSGLQLLDGTKHGALYYGTADGQPLRKAATIPMANGVGLSPDGKTVYVSDTMQGRLWALDIVGPGQVAPGQLPVMPGRVICTLPGFQWLDSLKVEAGGNICVGTIFNGGISVFGPDGSVDHIPVPAVFTTNLCFGGLDLTDVWITASSQNRIYHTVWPRPGLKLAFQA
ncbi:MULTISPECIES: SMP-30/gluconolactonase/LRE family protein [Sphingomonas]|uniref:SMP-30/gluconolactonase/LRE family protein n=1 Tax=Sphingomonas TaxID=13687 RepID=UPI000DEF779D|nr:MULTISPECIES: SMP-30/gluconolactonase/LRE family protein [Sphingomonas]